MQLRGITFSGGGISITTTPATPAYSWVFEGLETGFTGLTLEQPHGTIVWDSGGFARVTSTSAGVTSIRYTVPQGNPAICVQYEIRRQMLNCSKQLKVPSLGLRVSPYNKYANYTFGPTGGGYSNTRIGIYYSDASDGGDNSLAYYMTGLTGGGSVSYRSAPTFNVTQPSDVNQNITGTVWERYKVWWKPNSNNVADGEYAIWKDDVLIFHAINVWNCATTTSDGTNPGVALGDLYLYQDRGYVGLFEYANTAGVIEDYRNLKIGYDRPLDLP